MRIQPFKGRGIVEIRNVRFLENGKICKSSDFQKAHLEEVKVNIPLFLSSRDIVIPQSTPEIRRHNENGINITTQQVALRRPREEKNTCYDYMVHLSEFDFDIGIKKKSGYIFKAMKSDDSRKYINAINEELKSMDKNDA